MCLTVLPACLSSLLQIPEVKSLHSVLTFAEELQQNLPLGAAGVGAGGALVAGVPKGPRLRALTATTHTAAPAAAHLPVVRNAGRHLCRAVAVVADVAGMAFTLPAVTLPVAWWQKNRFIQNYSARIRCKKKGSMLEKHFNVTAATR